MFRFRVHRAIEMPPADLGVNHMRDVGEFSVKTVKDRIRKGIGSSDFPMPAYKDDKPVYIPISGYAGRAASTFSGPTISVRQAANLKRVGRLQVKDIRKNPAAQTTAKSIVRSSKTIRFPNWSTYKRAIGRSGLRDLEVTGAMNKAFGVRSYGMRSVEIGFTSIKQERKASGNEKIAHAYEFSPSDESKVANYVQRIYENRYK